MNNLFKFYKFIKNKGTVNCTFILSKYAKIILKVIFNYMFL
ncbi:hypothetical protein QQI_1411 [Clostridioides difficile Y401]|nr:hypothetical protein QQI_1411 [Clostridioides difficile Y401]